LRISFNEFVKRKRTVPLWVASSKSYRSILEQRATDAGGLSDDTLQAYEEAKSHIAETANIIRQHAKYKTPKSTAINISMIILAYKAACVHDFDEFTEIASSYRILETFVADPAQVCINKLHDFWPLCINSKLTNSFNNISPTPILRKTKTASTNSFVGANSGCRKINK
jgi:hypothetical protein